MEYHWNIIGISWNIIKMSWNIMEYRGICWHNSCVFPPRRRLILSADGPKIICQRSCVASRWKIWYNPSSKKKKNYLAIWYQYDTILLLRKFQKMTLTVAEMYFVHFFSYLYWQHQLLETDCVFFYNWWWWLVGKEGKRRIKFCHVETRDQVKASLWEFWGKIQ